MYWFSIFILSSKVHKEIKSITKDFLWSRVNLEKIKPKVAWKNICVPLKEVEEGG